MNVDHRIVHDAVLAATRPQPGASVREIRFFETVSSTEWRPPSSHLPFAPTLFVDISDSLVRKLEALQAYESEMRPWPHSRSIEAVEHLACWRGASVGCGAAEAFELGRRVVVGSDRSK